MVSKSFISNFNFFNSNTDPNIENENLKTEKDIKEKEKDLKNKELILNNYINDIKVRFNVLSNQLNTTKDNTKENITKENLIHKDEEKIFNINPTSLGGPDIFSNEIHLDTEEKIKQFSEGPHRLNPHYNDNKKGFFIQSNQLGGPDIFSTNVSDDLIQSNKQIMKENLKENLKDTQFYINPTSLGGPDIYSNEIIHKNKINNDDYNDGSNFDVNIKTLNNDSNHTLEHNNSDLTQRLKRTIESEKRQKFKEDNYLNNLKNNNSYLYKDINIDVTSPEVHKFEENVIEDVNIGRLTFGGRNLLGKVYKSDDQYNQSLNYYYNKLPYHTEKDYLETSFNAAKSA